MKSVKVWTFPEDIGHIPIRRELVTYIFSKIDLQDVKVNNEIHEDSSLLRKMKLMWAEQAP